MVDRKKGIEEFKSECWSESFSGIVEVISSDPAFTDLQWNPLKLSIYLIVSGVKIRKEEPMIENNQILGNWNSFIIIVQSKV